VVFRSRIRGGQPAVEPEDFVNRRSEWYWNLRLRFENCEIDIDPDDDVLAKQLVAIKWKMTSKGQIAVETKEEMRKRGLPSPDRADALVYSFIHMDAQSVDLESHAGVSITRGLDDKGVVIAKGIGPLVVVCPRWQTRRAEIRTVDL
jgi:hypothetical protein